MAGIKDYFVTAASNTSLFPEGMAPSAVNDGMRQVQADLRAQLNDAEWFQYGDGDGPAMAAYASATSFSVAGANVTAEYHPGRRIKAVGAATGTIYGTIASSSYSGNTVVNVTWDSGSLANEALAIHLAILRATNRSLPSGVLIDPLTTRGDLISRNGSNITARLPLGAASAVLKSDGTDAVWGTVDTAGIGNRAVTLAKLANSAQPAGVIAYDAGGSPVQTAAGTTGQVLTSNGNAAPTFQTPAFSRSYDSGEIAITANTTVLSAAPHGLGSLPKSAQVWLRCKASEFGYSAGDEFPTSVVADATTAGVALRFTSAIVSLTVGSSIRVLRIDTHIDGPITAANWRLIIRAQA